MTNEQAIKILDGIEEIHGVLPEDGNEVEEALNIAIKALQEQADRNEFYNWDAPIRHKADGEYISRKALLEDLYKRDYTKFTHRDFVALVQYQDIVAIPPEHDGCKECKYETYPDYYYPCCSCKQNYEDKWQKKPHWIMKHRTINEVKYHTGLDDMGEEHTIKELIRYEVDEPYCSECGMKAGDTSQNYCCFCGTKMGGEQELLNLMNGYLNLAYRFMGIAVEPQERSDKE